MRQLFAVALVVAVVAAPACAQRGGSRGGGGAGSRGGFSGHAGFVAPGGFARAGSNHFAGGAYAPRYRAGYGAGVRAVSPERGAPAARYMGPGVSGARPMLYSRNGERGGNLNGERGGWERGRDGRWHRAPYAYGGPLGYAYYAPLDYGWLDADDSGYGDDGSYGEDGSYDDGVYDNGAGDDGSGVAAESYGEQPPDGYAEPPAGYAEPPDGYAEPPVQYAEPAQERPAPTPAVAPSLYESDAVTLVFKDGRPPEKIHNYALTRTTLYVTDGRRQEIPVAELNLPATEQVNREAGVSFQLPVTQ